jgi:hypothetical protein
MMLEFGPGAVGYRGDDDCGRVTAKGIPLTAQCALHHCRAALET